MLEHVDSAAVARHYLPDPSVAHRSIHPGWTLYSTRVVRLVPVLAVAIVITLVSQFL